MIDFLKSDTIISKIIIALFSAILTIVINKLIDWFKERKRLNLLKKSIVGFIEENVLDTLQSTNIDYYNLKEILKNGRIIERYTINDYPWLNSKVFDYFSKNDVLKILNNIDYKQAASLNKHLIAMDFLQQNSPSKMFVECQDFLREHFKENNIPANDHLQHYFNCSGLIKNKDVAVSNVDLRKKQCEDLIIFFTDLKNKLKD